MRSKAIRARDVSTDHHIVIHDSKKPDRKYKVCEVYKNPKVVKIIYRETLSEGGFHFVTIKMKPMHRVHVS